MFTCLNVYMFPCLYVYMFTCLNVQMFTCLNVYMFKCFHVYMFKCLNVSMFKVTCNLSSLISGVPVSRSSWVNMLLPVRLVHLVREQGAGPESPAPVSHAPSSSLYTRDLRQHTHTHSSHGRNEHPQDDRRESG